jgi:hypothetical protein
VKSKLSEAVGDCVRVGAELGDWVGEKPPLSRTLTGLAKTAPIVSQTTQERSRHCIIREGTIVADHLGECQDERKS